MIHTCTNTQKRCAVISFFYCNMSIDRHTACKTGGSISLGPVLNLLITKMHVIIEPYFDHIGTQIFCLFAPEAIVKGLHQSVNLLPDTSILVGMPRQLFLAFGETGTPEEVLLCNHHDAFRPYGSLKFQRRPRRPQSFSGPLYVELLEWQVRVDGWRYVNADRKLNLSVWMLILQRNRWSMCSETGREFSYCKRNPIRLTDSLASGHQFV